MLKFASNHAWRIVAGLGLAFVLLSVFTCTKQVFFTPLVETEKQKETEKLKKELQEYVSAAERLKALKEETRADQSAYEKRGEHWTVKMIEAADKRAQELLDLLGQIEVQIKQLKGYNRPSVNGRLLEHEESLAQDKQEAITWKRFWEEEKKSRLEK